MENHYNGTQTVFASTSQHERERRIIRHRKRREAYKQLFTKLVKAQQEENSSSTVKFINPAGTDPGGARRLYYTIRIMAKKNGEPDDKSQVWKKQLDPTSIHFAIPIMPNAEAYIMRIMEGEMVIPVLVSVHARTRIHIANGCVEVKDSTLGLCKTSLITKGQTIEIPPKNLRLRRLTFVLKGVRALVLVEKVKTLRKEDGGRRKDKNGEETEEEGNEIIYSSSIQSTPFKQLKKKYACLRPQPHNQGNSQVQILHTERIEVPTEYQRGPVYSRVPVSYLRSAMPLEEIRRRLLFLDCEFVGGYKELVGTRWKGTQLLASIAIMDYEGRVILDTRVTPSKKIRSYCTQITGFRPLDLVNQRKDQEVIMEVRQLVQGRILVGHDLTSDMTVLQIVREELAGIRDLSTCPTLREIIPSENPRLSLKVVAEEILHKNLRMTKTVNGKQIPDPHSALEDVQVIREVYLKIESLWRDTEEDATIEMRHLGWS